MALMAACRSTRPVPVQATAAATLSCLHTSHCTLHDGYVAGMDNAEGDAVVALNDFGGECRVRLGRDIRADPVYSCASGQEVSPLSRAHRPVQGAKRRLRAA